MSRIESSWTLNIHELICSINSLNNHVHVQYDSKRCRLFINDVDSDGQSEN